MDAPDENPDAAPEKLGLFARFREWTQQSLLRKLLVGAGFLAMIGFTIGAWMLLVELAVQPAPSTVDLALAALDDGDNELAEVIVKRITATTELTPDEFGGPLYVMGVLKYREADRRGSPDRRRNDFFIASRYLSEAREVGFPETREAEGLFLLGASMIESWQLKRGIEVLLEALEINPRGASQLRIMLAEAYCHLPTPDYAAAIVHLDRELQDTAMTAESRAKALLLHAESLAHVGRFDEAVASIEADGAAQAPAKQRLVEAKIRLAQAANAAVPGGPSPLTQLLDEADSKLNEAIDLDRFSGEITRQAEYLKGQVFQLRGEQQLALEAYASFRRNRGASAEASAAAIAEGDLLRSMGEHEDAFAAYRRVLTNIVEPKQYRSGVLPLSELRTRILAAHAAYVSENDFEHALGVADHMSPLFTTIRQLEMRAQTLEAWGRHLVAEGSIVGATDKLMRFDGRRKLRQAGVIYEELSKRRFSTTHYPQDLWNAAEAYYGGQGFSQAIRVIKEYLKDEPQRLNALALLRLGQSQLSRGSTRRAIQTFEECLEFHASDATSYQARLECARAFLELGETDQGEALLNENLLGTSMTPSSPEWRDSQFELGRLLVHEERHDEAINTLSEWVTRYPDDLRRRLARYLMAESYRHAAAEPLRRSVEAGAVNEQERERVKASALLERSLVEYEIVQREITLDKDANDHDRAMLRNCYMLRGSVLFDLQRYHEAIEAYSALSTLYQNDPFILETLLQISNCWRRLKELTNARGAIEQAKGILERLPPETDFATSTNLTRNDWRQLLERMSVY
ncbi:Outer membrane protein assembly factor BamD [Pseudobythopirellula maris]|uniref:Outer membrane protein assembly factor BamD n=1 Tax=Pseudobythopirellula maris TaxID=2527991 RepID=A0A5C5ZHD3_9BACT|nr:tetratricopeptide repeat protein [Pseudobythopirellula maris]TWT86530.1 Outer membrane protein assembly factor BamD [Pseudobythopirellula maris]